MPAVGEIYQYTFQQLLDGQVMENVIHFRARASAPTDADLKQSAEEWLGIFKNMQTTFVTYPQVIIKQMTPIAFDEILFTPAVNVQGTQATNYHNSTVAIVITKRTGTAGGTHRGRLYVGGSPSTWGTDRLTIAPGPATVGTFAGQALAKFGEGGTDPTICAGIYSRVIGGSVPFTLAGWQPITKWDPQQIYGNQRRRRVGVGI
jgi:hypothetical protein